MATIQQMFQKVDAVVADYVAGGYQSIANDVAPAYWTGFTLYMMVWGLHYLRTGKGNFTDLGFGLMKGGLIGYVALNWGVFSDWAYTSLQALQDQLGGVLLGVGGYGGAGAPGEGAIAGGAAIDEAFGRIMDGVNRLLSEFGVNNWGPLFSAICILLSGLVLLGYAAFVFLFGKMAFAITVVLAPVFVPTALFNATRDIFGSWVRSVIGFVAIPMLAAAVIAFSLALLNDNIAQAQAGTIDLTTAAVTLFMSLCMWYVIRQVPSVAGGMVGAPAASGAGAMAEMFMRPIAREISGAGMATRWLRDRAAQRWGSWAERGRQQAVRERATSEAAAVQKAARREQTRKLGHG